MTSQFFIILGDRIESKKFILNFKESLRRRNVEWNYFYEFPTELAEEEAAKQSKGKKSITPKTSKRKRRAIKITLAN